MIKKKLFALTKDYHDELIASLRNPKRCHAYLKVAIEEYQIDHDIHALLLALRNVAEAQGGLSVLAEKTQLNRQNLYRALSSTGNPRLETFSQILKGLGFHISIQPNRRS